MQTGSLNSKDPQLMTARWVAGLTRLSEKTIYRAAREGKVPGTVKVLGSLRFNRNAVLKWLNGSTD